MRARPVGARASLRLTPSPATDVILVHLLTRPRPAHPRARLWAVALTLTAALAISACGSGSASTTSQVPPINGRANSPESVVSLAAQITADPTGTVAVLKQLGVDRVHFPIYWDQLAPDATSTHKPSVNLADPSSYAQSGFAPYDAALRALKAAHIGVILQLSPPPPRWASAPGAPHPASQTEWKPSAADFGEFVRAVATRYGGHYTPPGESAPLPRVNFWSLWNEPDLGVWLAPEVTSSQVEVAPHYYRQLVDAGWTALHATGHAADTILIGELAPAGIHSGSVGQFNSMPPLRFLRALYCVGSDLQPLTGTAATERGCPATAAASKQFAAQNPALFHASGVADHPYPQGLAPNVVTPDEPDYAELGDIPHLTAMLDKIQTVYGQHTEFPIWDTEFGYQTKPPDPEAGTVSPATAAYYLNWAEYITYRNPRLQSFDQYLLTDPTSGMFASGLLSPTGAPKPTYIAFRMPLYLPVTTGTKGQGLDVWGCVRPAPAAADSSHHPQVADVQYSAGGAQPYKTVAKVTITDKHGYFEVRHSFPGSGNVRIAWSPPRGPQIVSRTVAITLH